MENELENEEQETPEEIRKKIIKQYEQNSAITVNNALAKGLVVYEIRPDKDGNYPVISVDYDQDGRVDKRQFHTPLRKHETVSKRGNAHLYYRFDPPVRPEEVGVVAVSLGSDPIRELLAIRAQNSRLAYIMFETREGAKIVDAAVAAEKMGKYVVKIDKPLDLKEYDLTEIVDFMTELNDLPVPVVTTASPAQEVR